MKDERTKEQEEIINRAYEPVVGPQSTVAAILGINRQRVHKLASKGKIRVFCGTGVDRWVSVSDVKKHLEGGGSNE